MTRAQQLARAKPLRDQGLTYREIGERLSVATSTVGSWFSDPDGSRLKARKDTYRGTCEVCGAPTDGSNGRGGAPKRCAYCAATALDERNEQIFEMWGEGEPTWYIAEQFGMTEGAVGSLIHSHRRLLGKPIPVRRLSGDRMEREARHITMIEWRREGKSNTEIAQLLGTTRESVCTSFGYLRRKGYDVPYLIGPKARAAA